ncbi:hypothetical protein A6U86_16815 [Rhizobium sp. AC27/96]|uniref:hypothetical protein n=1 Tax=Rhizobium sp. AC27/96 TaxID=1841653 RepID=UPI00082911E3|nr:hypothetical protein [Rhizobium sp. AC27/96]OCI95809.1 hypothetical protein A6U86_16815 [Rhizobium sp. AC27/96]
MSYPSRKLSDDLATLWIQAPMVIGMRLSQMWMTAMMGGRVDTVEFSRMINEKMAAAGESVIAANTAMAEQNIAAMTAIAMGRNASSHKAADAIAQAAIKPYTKRVRSNVRRLSKQKD